VYGPFFCAHGSDRRSGIFDIQGCIPDEKVIRKRTLRVFVDASRGGGNVWLGIKTVLQRAPGALKWISGVRVRG